MRLHLNSTGFPRRTLAVGARACAAVAGSMLVDPSTLYASSVAQVSASRSNDEQMAPNRAGAILLALAVLVIGVAFHVARSTKRREWVATSGSASRRARASHVRNGEGGRAGEARPHSGIGTRDSEHSIAIRAAIISLESALAQARAVAAVDLTGAEPGASAQHGALAVLVVGMHRSVGALPALTEALAAALAQLSMRGGATSTGSATARMSRNAHDAAFLRAQSTLALAAEQLRSALREAAMAARQVRGTAAHLHAHEQPRGADSSDHAGMFAVASRLARLAALAEKSAAHAHRLTCEITAPVEGEPPALPAIAASAEPPSPASPVSSPSSSSSGSDASDADAADDPDDAAWASIFPATTAAPAPQAPLAETTELRDVRELPEAAFEDEEQRTSTSASSLATAQALAERARLLDSQLRSARDSDRRRMRRAATQVATLARRLSMFLERDETLLPALPSPRQSAHVRHHVLRIIRPSLPEGAPPADAAESETLPALTQMLTLGTNGTLRLGTMDPSGRIVWRELDLFALPPEWNLDFLLHLLGDALASIEEQARARKSRRSGHGSTEKEPAPTAPRSPIGGTTRAR